MTFEEKGTWVSAFVTLGAYVAYAVSVLARADGTPLTDVAYVPAMLVTMVVIVALSIFGYIAVAITNPAEADKSDVRDKEIHRHGQYVGGIVLSIAVLLPLGLAMAEFDQFWIANAIFLVGVISSVTASIVTIRAYRRGF